MPAAQKGCSFWLEERPHEKGVPGQLECPNFTCRISCCNPQSGVEEQVLERRVHREHRTLNNPNPSKLTIVSALSCAKAKDVARILDQCVLTSPARAEKRETGLPGKPDCTQGSRHAGIGACWDAPDSITA